MVKCFVVYAHELDADPVPLLLNETVAKLREGGITVVWDRDTVGEIGHNIRRDYNGRIAIEHINRFDYVLIAGNANLVSKYAEQNHVVRQELDMAIKRMALEDELIRQHPEKQLRRSVLPLILSGTKEEALPRFLWEMEEQIVYARAAPGENHVQKLLTTMQMPREQCCVHYYQHDVTLRNTQYILHNLPAKNMMFTGRAEEMQKVRESLHTGLPVAVCSANRVGGVNASSQASHHTMAAEAATGSVSPAPNQHSTPSPTHDLAVSGMGGIGKSQLVKALGHEALERGGQEGYPLYQLVWWIDCSSKIRFDQSYQELAERLSHAKLMQRIFESEKKEITYIISEVHQSLLQPTLGNWLLIYDDARPEALLGKGEKARGGEGEVKGSIERWLPKGIPERYHPSHLSGHILITSRSPYWHKDRILKLDTFTLQDALAYLDRLLPAHSTADKTKLADLLGKHPLALSQAAGYIANDEECTIADYTSLFLQERIALLADRGIAYEGIEDYAYSVAATMGLSCAALIAIEQWGNQEGATTEERTRARAARLALAYLDIGCFLSPGFAPKILYENYATLHDYHPKLDLPKAFELLEAYGLGSKEVDDALHGIHLHEVVQYVIEDGLGPAQHQVRLCQAMQVVALCYSRDMEVTPRTQIQWEKLRAHADRLLSHAEKAVAKRTDLRQRGERNHLLENMQTLSDNASNICERMGRYRERLPYAEQNLAATQRLYPKQNNKHTAASLNNLGNAWSALGEPRKALGYFEQSLAMKQQVRGENAINSDIASTLNNIGGVWSALREPRKALGYFEQSLAIERQVYGENAVNSDIAHTMNNIGTIWSALGEKRKALGYYEQTLAMWHQVYGEDAVNSDIAHTMNNIGTIWFALREPREALGYFEQSLAMNLKVYGNNTINTDIAMTLDNLGEVWSSLSDYEKALNYHDQSLAMQRHVYGAAMDNTDTAQTYDCMGRAWAGLGNHSKAIELYESALAIKRKVYGEHVMNADLARTLNLAGTVYLALGEMQKALNFHEQSLAMYQHVQGQQAKNRDIASVLENLSKAWAALGNMQKAQEYKQLHLAQGIAAELTDSALLPSATATFAANAASLLTRATMEKERGAYQTASALCTQASALLTQQPEHAADLEQLKKLEKTIAQCTQLQSLLEVHLAKRDWTKLKLCWSALLKASPNCVAHYRNAACYLHAEAMDQAKAGQLETSHTLMQQAEAYFQQALKLKGDVGTLAEYGQFLYIAKRRDDAERYLNGALSNYSPDISCADLTYHFTLRDIVIPVLQNTIDHSVSKDITPGHISLHPLILAYALLVTITTKRVSHLHEPQNNQDHSQDLESAKHYVQQMYAVVLKNPSPIHHSLFANACKEADMPHLASTVGFVQPFGRYIV